MPLSQLQAESNCGLRIVIYIGISHLLNITSPITLTFPSTTTLKSKFYSIEKDFFSRTKSKMAVGGNVVAEEHTQKRLWVETPLRESYALSQAAGWYGLTSPAPPISPTTSFRDKQF
jgi:hypothetical protein